VIFTKFFRLLFIYSEVPLSSILFCTLSQLLVFLLNAQRRLSQISIIDTSVPRQRFSTLVFTPECDIVHVALTYSKLHQRLLNDIFVCTFLEFSNHVHGLNSVMVESVSMNFISGCLFTFVISVVGVLGLLNFNIRCVFVVAKH